MNLLNIGVFIAGGIIYKFIPASWRGWALLIGSVLAIYWLQPAISVHPVDFWLPTTTLVLAFIGWLLTRKTPEFDRDSQWTLGLVTALIVLIALVGGTLSITPSQPPSLIDVLLPLVGITLVLITLAAMIPEQGKVIGIFTAFIVAIFVILKADVLTQGAALFLRGQTGYLLSLASGRDLQWLGFSYVSFRMIHTLRDRQTGKLPALTLREYLTYLLFFPAYTAGPIDRAERFVKDYRALPTPDATRQITALSRIAIGIFKKFVIADSLAIFALSATSAYQAQHSLDMWLLLYAYSIRLFLDFSGYSDIAIGIGRLFGIDLPENFNRPYFKDNLTAFWQSWHMTLSNWARAYIFTPLSRALMGLKNKPSPTLVVLTTQVATMVVIGLWHGITLNFVIWGVYHGIGLFAHKIYTDNTRTFYQNLNQRPRLKRFTNWISIVLTFHFVALGWVWFALPDVGTSLHVFAKLFGG